MRHSSKELQSSGVTMGGRDGQVAHPWEVWGNFGKKGEWGKREGRGKKGKKGRKGKRGEEKRANGEEKKGNCKRRGNLFNKMERERYKNEQRKLFFFFFFFFLLIIFWTHCTKMEISTGKNRVVGNFITSLAHLWLQTWLHSCSKTYTSWGNY